MQKFFLPFIFIICLTINANAYDPDSAARDLDVDFSFYEQRATIDEYHNASAARITPLGTSRIYTSANLPAATNWASNEVMMERFKVIRDLRFIEWKRNGTFRRRSSWLYPDDGCYARAALAVKNISRLSVPVPKKVFAFGNLRIRTANSPRGRIGWWYHVAPIVEVAGVKYVLDPAIEPAKPLQLSDWLSRMGNPAKIKVAICSSGAYAPRSNCYVDTDGLERRSERSQYRFLNLEWRRLIRLGRNPVKELGANPPWL